MTQTAEIACVNKDGEATRDSTINYRSQLHNLISFLPHGEHTTWKLLQLPQQISQSGEYLEISQSGEANSYVELLFGHSHFPSQTA